MANEIHSLKIGDVEYPIYSEGIKIDDQVSGSAFLVVDGPDNRKVGTSTAIIGDDTNLTISSNEMYVGDSAAEVIIGTYGTTVSIGTAAEEVIIGTYGTTVSIGTAAEEVIIGNQCEGNVVIGNGSVWTHEDEDGNEIVEKTTFTYIGTNNKVVTVGSSAENVVLGPNAKNVVLGPNAKNINIGSIGSAATDYMSIVTGHDENEAIIEFSESEGLYDTSQKINIKSTEGKASGDDIYSQLVLNGAEVDLISKYNSTSKSSIDMDDEQIIINNYKPSRVFSDTKAISEVSVGEGVDIESDHCNINLSATQGGINISTQYLADDLSAETGDLGDINIQSSAGQINLNSYSDTNIGANGDLNLTAGYGDVDITSENCNINISTLGSDAEDNGFITIEAERDANIIAHGNINIDASYGDGETTGFVNINAEGNVGISSGIGKVNILAETGISLESSNNTINIASDESAISVGEVGIDIISGAGLIDIISGETMYISSGNNYDMYIGSNSDYHTGCIYIGHNAVEVDISGHDISIGNAGQVDNTNNIYVEAPNIYIAGMTTVYPEECTNTEFNTGFSVLRGDNTAVGVVFCAPSAADAAMVILPKNAYNSTSNVVSLGITSKRFYGLYVVNGYATNGFSTSSDERLKDFGDDITIDLDALAALRKSYYRWNEASGYENEKDRMLGMSAQEVQKIYPEVVNIDDEGMLSMAYDRLSVVALAAIDKLHETNKALKAENDELKDRITKLENLVDAILSRIN